MPSGDEIEVAERQLQPIEHATGSCFQPSLADVGKKICVHALPVCKDQDYRGMPLFAEIGPLKLDPKLQTEVDAAAEKIL